MAELQDSAFGSRFEPDAFYESFQAPKFHDFTAPEEPIDPDAFFMTQPEMVIKKAVAMKDVKIMAPKLQKVTAQGATKTAQGSLEQVPPKAPIVVDKAVWNADLLRKSQLYCRGRETTEPKLPGQHYYVLGHWSEVTIISCTNATSPRLSNKASFVFQESGGAIRAQISRPLHKPVSGRTREQLLPI